MKKILIIEDDKRIAQALSIRFRYAGYDPSTAPDGLQGLKAAITTRPDLIVMDVWLPKGMGFAVAETLTACNLGGIPIIVITASRRKGLWEAAQAVGAHAFFRKPLNSEKLLAAIALALEGPARTEDPSLLSRSR